MFGCAQLSAWSVAGVLRGVWMRAKAVVYRRKARYVSLDEGILGEEGVGC